TSIAGTPETIAFSATGLPAGATATFAPTSATAGGSSTLTLATDTTTPEGTYTITVTGIATSATHDTSVTLEVTAQSHHGGCGCGVAGANPASGAIFVLVLGFALRRRRHASKRSR